MLAEFGSWWLQQMLDLLPARLVRPDAAAVNAVVVSAEPGPQGGYDQAALQLRRNRKLTDFAQVELDAGGLPAARRALAAAGRGALVVLRLDQGLLLEREVALPLAAERDIERVLHYDMDRLTPFGAAEVFWTWTLLRRDRAQGRLHARVSLVPQAGVLPLLGALEAIGLKPAMLEIGLPYGEARSIGLQHEDASRVRRRQRAVIAAGAVCAALAIAAVVIPFVRQSFALDALQARIDALRPRVAEAETLRRRIANETTGADALASARARTGDALQVLAALTDILPDDTSLTAFTLRQRQITMEGRSAAAVKLIGGLSADPVIRNPTFAAPVVRDETNADIFSIRAELGP